MYTNISIAVRLSFQLNFLDRKFKNHIFSPFQINQRVTFRRFLAYNMRKQVSKELNK